MVGTLHSQGTLIGFGNPRVADNAVFLPYLNNSIYSAVLPGNVAATGSPMFFTVSLSGCSIFVDRVTYVPPPNPGGPPGLGQIQVGDLIVYHANAISLAFTPAQVQANPTTPNIPQQDKMRTQHRDATYHFMHPGLAGFGCNVTTCGKCEKADYFQAVNREMERKMNQWRSKVDFQGGTNVVGFLNGGTWEFWFQTWGWLCYSRTPSPSLSIPSLPTPGNLAQGLEVMEGMTKDRNSPPKIWQARRFLSVP